MAIETMTTGAGSKFRQEQRRNKLVVTLEAAKLICLMLRLERKRWLQWQVILVGGFKAAVISCRLLQHRLRSPRKFGTVRVVQRSFTIPKVIVAADGSLFCRASVFSGWRIFCGS